MLDNTSSITRDLQDYQTRHSIVIPAIVLRTVGVTQLDKLYKLLKVVTTNTCNKKYYMVKDRNKVARFK